MLLSEILLVALLLMNNPFDIHISAACKVQSRTERCGPRASLPGCYIQVQVDFGGPHQPLVLINNNGRTDFAYPAANSKTIVIENCRQIEIYCPGGYVLKQEISLFTDSIQLTCDSGVLYYYNELVYFNLITCSREAKHDIKYDDNNGTNDYVNFKIGYNHRSNFIPLIHGYFNESTQSTEYTTHIISKAIIGRQVYNRSSWAKGPFFKGINIDVAYKRDVQRIAINWQISLDKESTKYVPKTGQHYLSRGHLTPKADFIYGSQQSATFYFANAIPQWQMCNNGNWKGLESNIQRLAVTRMKDLRIFTGTFRVMELPDEITDSPTELYLYPYTGRNLVPIPEYIWKVVYDEDSRAGVGFVILNNPYVNASDYHICNTICNQLSYITFNPTNETCGYVYCCEVNAMRWVIPNIPPFRVDRLL